MSATPALVQHVRAQILPLLAAHGRPQAHSLLARAVDRLPVRSKTILALGYHHELTLPEMAAVLELPVHTLRWQAQDAVEELRLALLALLEDAA
jgi:DNA-directed RNA polymerase specialized sigma24 family protein